MLRGQMTGQDVTHYIRSDQEIISICNAILVLDSSHLLLIVGYFFLIEFCLGIPGLFELLVYCTNQREDAALIISKNNDGNGLYQIL